MFNDISSGNQQCPVTETTMTGSEADEEDDPVGKLQGWQGPPAPNAQEGDSDQNKTLHVVA